MEIRGKQPRLSGTKGLSQTEGVWTLSGGSGEPGKWVWRGGFFYHNLGCPGTHCAAQNDLDSRCQPLCLRSAVVWVMSDFVFNYFYQCPPENNLEDCEEVAGGHRFYGLDRTVALCSE